MATGFPVKANYATGDVLTAANMNDLAGTLNYLDPTAKGDLFPASDGSTLTRLAVGTNGQVLTADSTATTGMKWATAASGGGMTLLSTTTLSGASTTISSIDGSYTDLAISIENLVGSASSKKLAFRFNGITSGTYYGHLSYGGSGTTSVSFFTSAASGSGNGAGWVSGGKIILPDNTLTTDGSGFRITIPSYSITTAPKILNFYGGDRTAGNTYNGMAELLGTTAAISSFTILSDDGTTTMTGTVKIYGVK